MRPPATEAPDAAARRKEPADADVAATRTPLGRRRKGQPRSFRRTAAVRACQVLLLAVVLGLWQLCADRGWVDTSFSSRPSDVWSALLAYYQSGRLVDSLGATLVAVLLAFAIGTFAGALCGFVFGMNQFLDRVVGPFLVPLNSIPRIALAPLFILWFGLTTSAKVWVAVSGVFFVLAFNARAAVKDVDPDLLTMARVTGLSRAGLLLKVILPSSVPTLFAGVRLAITYSLLGVVGSEMIAAKSGIGQDIVGFSNLFDIGSVFAVLLELAVIATLINLCFEAFERRLLRWQTP